MNRLLANSPLAEQLGKTARAHYEQLFSGHALGRDYAALFKQVVKHG